VSLADSFFRPSLNAQIAIKKRAKRALDTGDMCRSRHIPSKPGAVSSPTKKRAKRALDTGDMCWRRRIPSKPGAVYHEAKMVVD